MSGLQLYVEKDSDLMRTTFVAVGLAELLYQLSEPGSGADVRIRDLGSAYLVQGDLALEAYQNVLVQRGSLPVLLPALRKKMTAKEMNVVKGGSSDPGSIRRRYEPAGFAGAAIDYEAERQKVEADRAARKAAPQEGAMSTRAPDFPLWANLISNFGGSMLRVVYPLVLHVWHSHKGAQAVLLLNSIVAAYGSFPNDIEAADEYWKGSVKPLLEYADFDLFGWARSDTKVSSLAPVSPTTAKGTSRSSAVLSLNNDTPEVFWLVMYLAVVGYMLIGLPYRSGDDVLLYYPLPADIRVSRLKHLLAGYRSEQIARDLSDYSGLMPRAKVDALCQISFYREMLRHFRRNPVGGRRRDAISGLVGYYYKNLTAHTPFDETTFELPPWMAPLLDLNEDALVKAEEILSAHYDLIYKALRGDYAEELTILGAYRRFITLGDADDWIEFCILYGLHRFRKLEDQPRLPWIHIKTLEDTLMNQDRKDYRPILENWGFRNIAAAIRACTVTLLRRKLNKRASAFRIRYGLGDDLRRYAHDPDRFIESLGGFVADYQRESSSVVKTDENEWRPSITETDLYEVIELVNKFGSRVVANLLVAAGYASDSERKEN